MIEFLIILLVSFLATAVTTPIAIRISYAFGALDFPSDPTLKIHKRPIPFLGGIPISLGIITSIIIIGLQHEISIRVIMGLLISLLLILSAGLYDDKKEMKPALRLVAQICVALIIIFVSRIAVNIIPVWYISIPITILCLIAAVNSINLLDGLDDLAAGMTLIASCSFFIAFFLRGDTTWATISLALTGVTLGFLIFSDR